MFHPLTYALAALNAAALLDSAAGSTALFMVVHFVAYGLLADTSGAPVYEFRGLCPLVAITAAVAGEAFVRLPGHAPPRADDHWRGASVVVAPLRVAAAFIAAVALPPLPLEIWKGVWYGHAAALGAAALGMGLAYAAVNDMPRMRAGSNGARLFLRLGALNVALIVASVVADTATALAPFWAVLVACVCMFVLFGAVVILRGGVPPHADVFKQT